MCAGNRTPDATAQTRDRKADLSDLRDIKTHAGVLVFDAMILPSGRVANIRLMSKIDTEHPWPTIAERWKSEIAEWRYQPVIVNNKPVPVCLAIKVIVHVT
jgi:hypothetical protein